MRHARRSMPEPYVILLPGHRALTNPGQPGCMVGAGRRVLRWGHVLLFYSCSSPLLELGQNHSKPSCVQLPMGKGNMELEKRNKS